MNSLAKYKKRALIYTCLTARAVYQNSITSLTTAEVRTAFQTFFADRGTPKIILTDNAAQFHLIQQYFPTSFFTNFRPFFRFAFCHRYLSFMFQILMNLRSECFHFSDFFDLLSRILSRFFQVLFPLGSMKNMKFGIEEFQDYVFSYGQSC